MYSAYLAEEKDLYYLNIHGENGKKTGYFPFMETVLSSSDKQTFFFTDGENWYYRQFFDDTIYRLEGDKLIAAYRFDFGENAYPGEVLLKAKTIDEFHRLLSRKKVVVLTDFSKPVYAQLFRSERKDFPFATRNGGMSEIGLKSESIKTCLLCLIDKANKIIAHVKEDKTRTVHYLKAIVDNYLN